MKSSALSRGLLMTILSICIASAATAREIKLAPKVLSESEVQQWRDRVGVYDPGKNYNIVIDGHGTGLIPPTEAEWQHLQHAVVQIELPAAYTMPEAHDNSATKWFPPVGSQGSEGSCAAWALVYYVKTFQEAFEHDWDLSACTWENNAPSQSYWNKIFSPDFTYHQLNGGQDGGSSFIDNMHLLNDIGCSTWNTMPYDPNDSVTWPDESAWREAPIYRSLTHGKIMLVNTDQGISELKYLLTQHNLAVIRVDAEKYTNLTSSLKLHMRFILLRQKWKRTLNL